jgi:Bacterial regulatory helix-turn-helix protein, lysR family
MALNEIKLMEAAIALAEELNFSRAAQKLHISQPALTNESLSWRTGSAWLSSNEIVKP